MNFEFCSKFVRTLSCMSIMMFALPLIKSPQAFVIPPEQINKVEDEYVREEINNLSNKINDLENNFPEVKSYTEIVQCFLVDNLDELIESGVPFILSLMGGTPSSTAQAVVKTAVQQSLADCDVVMNIESEADWSFMTAILLTGSTSASKEQFKGLLKTVGNCGTPPKEEFLNTNFFRFKSNQEAICPLIPSLCEPVVRGDRSPFVDASGLQLFPGINIPGMPYTPGKDIGTLGDYLSCRRSSNRVRIENAPNVTDVPAYFSQLFDLIWRQPRH